MLFTASVLIPNEMLLGLGFTAIMARVKWSRTHIALMIQSGCTNYDTSIDSRSEFGQNGISSRNSNSLSRLELHIQMR